MLLLQTTNINVHVETILNKRHSEQLITTLWLLRMWFVTHVKVLSGGTDVRRDSSPEVKLALDVLQTGSLLISWVLNPRRHLVCAKHN